MDELEPGLHANERSQEAIRAFMEAVRKEPHAECVWPLYAECINAQGQYDDTLFDLADTGRMLLAANDTE